MQIFPDDDSTWPCSKGVRVRSRFLILMAGFKGNGGTTIKGQIFKYMQHLHRIYLSPTSPCPWDGLVLCHVKGRSTIAMKMKTLQLFGLLVPLIECAQLVYI